MKQRTGYLFKDKATGKWVARVTFTDEAGKRRNVKRYCETKTEAREKLDVLKRDIKERGQQSVDGDKLRFRDVAERYEQTKLIEPVYVGEKKVAGMRSLYTPKLYVKTLVSHFGNKRVRSITHNEIEAYKLARLKTETRSQKQRSIAAVNRELETLRAVLNFAKRQGWILINPFTQGEALIDRGAENSRDRILSFDEEARLLAACDGKRVHLRPLVIAALDTGMRRGELFKLEWKDVDLAARTITLPALITKTNKTRGVAMTDRVHNELQELWRASPQRPTDSVFGLTDNIKKGWTSACKAAGIEGLRFHDLRHTFVSRLIAAGVQHTEAMKLSGHQTLAMLNRYLNTNTDTARRAADALDEFRRVTVGETVTGADSTLVN
jgi:integrase